EAAGGENGEDIGADVYDEPEEEIVLPGEDDVGNGGVGNGGVGNGGVGNGNVGSDNAGDGSKPFLYYEFGGNAEESDGGGEDKGYVCRDMEIRVGVLDEYGGVSVDGDGVTAGFAMDIPEDVELSGNTGLRDGVKVMEIGGLLWRAEQGYDPSNMKRDMVSGRTVTVYEEKEGDGSCGYEYMLHSSVPDSGSESGVYETYTYIIGRGEYMGSVSFMAGAFDEGEMDRMVKSAEIRERE
ncbi:MAG: hypothetical protein NC078_12440, partial [Ruminococcus sp.]|nr:hypothetical protein [Ruminococcus sp.]